MKGDPSRAWMEETPGSHDTEQAGELLTPQRRLRDLSNLPRIHVEPSTSLVAPARTVCSSDGVIVKDEFSSVAGVLSSQCDGTGSDRSENSPASAPCKDLSSPQSTPPRSAVVASPLVKNFRSRPTTLGITVKAALSAETATTAETISASEPPSVSPKRVGAAGSQERRHPLSLRSRETLNGQTSLKRVTEPPRRVRTRGRSSACESDTEHCVQGDSCDSSSNPEKPTTGLPHCSITESVAGDEVAGNDNLKEHRVQLSRAAGGQREGKRAPSDRTISGSMGAEGGILQESSRHLDTADPFDTCSKRNDPSPSCAGLRPLDPVAHDPSICPSQSIRKAEEMDRFLNQWQPSKEVVESGTAEVGNQFQQAAFLLQMQQQLQQLLRACSRPASPSNVQVCTGSHQKRNEVASAADSLVMPETHRSLEGKREGGREEQEQTHYVEAVLGSGMPDVMQSRTTTTSTSGSASEGAEIIGAAGVPALLQGGALAGALPAGQHASADVSATLERGLRTRDLPTTHQSDRRLDQQQRAQPMLVLQLPTVEPCPTAVHLLASGVSKEELQRRERELQQQLRSYQQQQEILQVLLGQMTALRQNAEAAEAATAEREGGGMCELAESPVSGARSLKRVKAREHSAEPRANDDRTANGTGNGVRDQAGEHRSKGEDGSTDCVGWKGMLLQEKEYDTQGPKRRRTEGEQDALKMKALSRVCGPLSPRSSMVCHNTTGQGNFHNGIPGGPLSIASALNALSLVAGGAKVNSGFLNTNGMGTERSESASGVFLQTLLSPSGLPLHQPARSLARVDVDKTTVRATNALGIADGGDAVRAGLASELSLPVGSNAWSSSDQEMLALLAGSTGSVGRGSLLAQHQQRAAEYARLARLLPRINRLTFSTQTLMWVVRVQTRRTRLCKSFSVRKMGFLPARQAAVDFLADFDRQEQERQQERPASPTAPQSNVSSAGSERATGCLESVSQECCELGQEKERDRFPSLCACCGKQRLVPPEHKGGGGYAEASVEATRSGRGLSEPCRPGRLAGFEPGTETRSRSLEESGRRHTIGLEQDITCISDSVPEKGSRQSGGDTSPKTSPPSAESDKWPSSSQTLGLTRRRTTPSSASSADRSACETCTTRRKSSPTVPEKSCEAGDEAQATARSVEDICVCEAQGLRTSDPDPPEDKNKVSQDEDALRSLGKSGKPDVTDRAGFTVAAGSASTVSSAGCCCPRSERNEQIDGPEPSAAALRDGREANLQHLHQRQQQHERRKHAREDLAVRARQLPHTVGVKFDPTCPRWIAHWKREGQRFFKSFSVEKNGFENAWQLAKLCRKKNAELAAAATISSPNTATSAGSRRRSSHSSSARLSGPQRRVLNRIGTDMVSSGVTTGAAEDSTKASENLLPALTSPSSGVEGGNVDSAHLGPSIPQTSCVGDSVRGSGSVYPCVGGNVSNDQRTSEAIWRDAEVGACLPLASNAQGPFSEAEAAVSFLARTAGLASASKCGDQSNLGATTAEEVAGLRAFCNLVAPDVSRGFPVSGHVVSERGDNSRGRSATAPYSAAASERLPGPSAAQELSCSLESSITRNDSLLSALLACQGAAGHSFGGTSVDVTRPLSESVRANKDKAAGHWGSSRGDGDSPSVLGCTTENTAGSQISPSLARASGPEKHSSGSEGGARSCLREENHEDEVSEAACKLGRGRSLSVPARPCPPLEGLASSRQAIPSLAVNDGSPSSCRDTSTRSSAFVGKKEATPDELHSKENVRVQQLPQSDQLQKAMRLCSAMLRQEKESGHDQAADTEARRASSHPVAIQSPRLVEQFTQLPPGFSLPPAGNCEGLVTSPLLLLLAQQQQARSGGAWDLGAGWSASSPASPAASPGVGEGRGQDDKSQQGTDAGLPGNSVLRTDRDAASQCLTSGSLQTGLSSSNHRVLGSGKSDGTVSGDAHGVFEIDSEGGLVCGGSSKLCGFSPSELLMLTSQLSAMNALCAPHKQKLVAGAGNLADEMGWPFQESKGGTSGDHSVPVTPSTVSGACPSVETPTISSARTSAGTCPESGGTSSKCYLQGRGTPLRPDAATDVKLRAELNHLCRRSTDQPGQSGASKGVGGSALQAELHAIDNGSNDERKSESNSEVDSWAGKSGSERVLSKDPSRALCGDPRSSDAVTLATSSPEKSKAAESRSDKQDLKANGAESNPKEDGERLTFAKMALSMILRNLRDVCLDTWRRTLQLSVDEPYRRLAEYIELVEVCDSEIPEVRALLVTFSDLIAEQRLPSALPLEAQRTLLAEIYTAVAVESGSEDLTQHVCSPADHCDAR